MTRLGVPCSAVVRVEITAPAQHRCPFKDEIDQGTVRIGWTTAHGETVELHALVALINAHRDTEISHEQWTADLAAAITAEVGVGSLAVTSEWSTAGARVSVAADEAEASDG